MPYKLGMMRLFATARHGKSISAFRSTGVLLLFIQCTLYTFQGRSLIPPHFPLISLAHMGHCEGHPAFPTFPLVPGISEDLPDPLFADPSNTYSPTFTTA